MKDARALLRQGGLAPKKSFGQNFLISERVVRNIAGACIPDDEVGRADIVEFGAGLGALTSELLPRARHVTAIERDRELVPILTSALEDDIASGKLTIEESDAASADLSKFFPSAVESNPGCTRVLCGNLPYQITGRLLQRAVDQVNYIDRVVFMVQDEVAARLTAKAGTKSYGALTVFVRAAFDVARVMTVGRGCFHPAPDVTSAVVSLTPLRPRITEETETFRAVVKQAFAMRRKTLRNAWRGLAPDTTLSELASACGISLDARGETLDVAAFANMARTLDRSRGLTSI